MNIWGPIAAAALAAAVGLQPGTAAAQSGQPGRDIGGEARGVFAARCAGCHGPDLAKPQGRFGYVLDLKRIAANPELVVPSRPDESELWALVNHDEMPPADSPHGALTNRQKEIIRSWIAAGAPDASPNGPDSSPSVQSESTLSASAAGRLLRWAGKLHLLVIHFPIALVFAAGVAEAVSAWRRESIPSESVQFCLRFAALAAVAAAGLGWLFAAAGNGVSSPQLLTAHRWLGTTAAVWLVATAVCAERDSRRRVRSRRTRLLLMGAVVVTAVTAHVGGLLAFGRDFFAY